MTITELVWTTVDEAPALASHALLPILRAYTAGCDIDVQTSDISLAGRILANFPEAIDGNDKPGDALARLGALVKTPEAIVVKLPNISASIPQLQAAIAELQAKGFAVPDYPEEPQTAAEQALQQRFAKVLGSAVNPVLREGNSDRRAAAAVKKFAQKNPHRMMRPWPETDSKARVTHMSDQDFFASERATTIETAVQARIEFVPVEGPAQVLKEKIELLAGEIIDTAVMSAAALRRFFVEQIDAAKQDGVLLSLHLKTTMMKISDPIMFGHCVSVYYAAALDKHATTLREIGANPRHGLGDLLAKLDRLPAAKRQEIEADIAAVYESRPPLAMVNSAKGITNLHVPNNIIIDASMPNIIRDGGKMWNSAGELQDTIAMVPDRSYATLYKEVILDCQEHGQFDPSTMGSVANVGLMAQKAEEYGSHDKTFEASGPGVIRVIDAAGELLIEQPVAAGDIFRMCQVKDEPIRDWVQLAVRRARAAGTPAVFWLDDERAHDREVMKKVELYLGDHNTAGLDMPTMKPQQAMRFSLARVRRGEDTISVTGNILRDYLTDLFPILELGTSARMLSIVPLLNGGGLFETGAGGSAPKHVQQFLAEGHLRWDSLGEYCALVPCLELIAAKTGNKKAGVLAAALDEGIGTYLENARAPERQVGKIDNRGSSFYLALYWAQALAAQGEDAALQQRFAPVAAAMAEREEEIVEELLAAQGAAVDIGGYYLPDAALTARQMRPSAALNHIIDGLAAQT